MCSDPTFGPFTAESSTHPGPFPLGSRKPQGITRSEVKRALESAPIIYTVGDEYSGTRVQRVADQIVVKHGAGVSASEALTMDFVRQRTTVRLPTVYDHWVEARAWPDGTSYDVCYIVMDYIPGAPLSSMVKDVTQEQWLDLSAQLEDTIRQLQCLRSHVPGPVGGGLSTATLFTDYGAGPFNSIQELASWFNERLAVCHHFGKALDITSFQDDIKDLVMCHMDIHANNIMLDQNNKIWLVDWACAGFYPRYFEFVKLAFSSDMKGFTAMLNGLQTADEHEKVARLRKIGFALTTAALCKPEAVVKPPPCPDRSRELSAEEFDSMTKAMISQATVPN